MSASQVGVVRCREKTRRSEIYVEGVDELLVILRARPATSKVLRPRSLDVARERVRGEHPLYTVLKTRTRENGSSDSISSGSVERRRSCGGGDRESGL